MTDTKYIAFRHDGDIINEGLTLENAAHEILTYDGYEYEIKQEDGIYKLYVSTHSSNSTLGAKNKNEWFDYAANTEQGVYALVWELGGVHDAFIRSEGEYKEYLELTAEQ